MDNNILVFLFIFIGLVIFFIVLTLISMYSGSVRSTMDQKRKKQMKAQESRKSPEEKDRELKEQLDRLVKPLTDNVIPRLGFINLSLTDRKLRVVGWDKKISAKAWTCLTLLLGLLGLLIFIFMASDSVAFAGIVALILIASPSFLLNNEYQNISDDILLHFPETIRVITAHLSADAGISRAFTLAAETASKRWKPLLLEFSAKCSTKGDAAAISWIKQQIDIMEAREFFAAVTLALTDGMDPKDAFLAQAEMMEELLKDANQKKIEKRKVVATILQGPLILLLIIAFALPIIGQFKDLMGAMK